MLADVPHRLSWRALLAVVRHSPRTSALARHLVPAVEHTAQLEVMRAAEYALRLLLWSKTKDAETGRNRPKPIRFPWEPKIADAGFGDVRPDVLPVDEMRARLGW